MRIYLIHILITATTLCYACSQSESVAPHQLRQQFKTQLQHSRQTGGMYYKLVQDPSKIDSQPEKQVLNLSMDESSDISAQLETELTYALANVYDEPKQIEYMHIEQRGDTLIAQRDGAAPSSIELNLQKVLLEKESRRIRYIESQLVKKNWLYGSEVHIWVVFDSLGRYQQHQLTIETDIALSKHHFQAFISGKVDYD